MTAETEICIRVRDGKAPVEVVRGNDVLGSFAEMRYAVFFATVLRASERLSEGGA